MDLSMNNTLMTSCQGAAAVVTAAAAASTRNMSQVSSIQQPGQRLPGEKVKSRWTRSFVTAVDSHNEHGDRFVCDICQKDLATPQTLSLHRSTHFIVRRYRCEICKTSFNTQGHLHKHRRSSAHESRVQAIEEAKGNCKLENPRPFGCPKCNVAFRKQGHLSKHLRSKSHFNRMEACGLVPTGTYAAFERSAPDVKDSLVTTDYQQALDSLRSIVCTSLCMSLEGCAQVDDSSPGSSSPSTECAPITAQLAATPDTTVARSSARQRQQSDGHEKDNNISISSSSSSNNNNSNHDSYNQAHESPRAYLKKKEQRQQHPAAAAPPPPPPPLAHHHSKLGPALALPMVVGQVEQEQEQELAKKLTRQQRASISMDSLQQHPTLALLNRDGLHRPDPMMDLSAASVAEQSGLDGAVATAEAAALAAASQVLLHGSCKAAPAPAPAPSIPFGAASALYRLDAPPPPQQQQQSSTQLNHLMYATASNANKLASQTHQHQHHPRHERRPMSRSHVI